MKSLVDEPAPSTQPSDGEGWDAPGLQIEIHPPGEIVESMQVTLWKQWPDQADLLEWCRESDNIVAAVLLFAGVAYAIFGYQMYRLLACLNVAALGVWAGWWVGKQFDATAPGMIIGGVVAAAIAWPAVRVAVAACGGIVGFAIGCAIWRSLGMSDGYAAAGGGMGAIFLFMLTFVVFRASIIVFTAVQGALMFAAGLLGILLKYPDFDEPLSQWIAEQPVILPVALFALSVVGVFYQQAYGPKPTSDSGTFDDRRRRVA